MIEWTMMCLLKVRRYPFQRQKGHNHVEIRGTHEGECAMRHSIRYRLVAGIVAALLFGPGRATPAFAMARHVFQRTQPVSITHLHHTHHALALQSSLEPCS